MRRSQHASSLFTLLPFMELSPLIQCWAYDEATLPQGNGTVPWSNASGQIHAATQAPCPQCGTMLSWRAQHGHHRTSVLFSTEYSQQTPHSLPVRASYGVSVVSSKSGTMALLHTSTIKRWCYFGSNWHIPLITWSIFSRIPITDTPKLTHEDEIWGVFCEFKSGTC